jgi:hypothetical protein
MHHAKVSAADVTAPEFEERGSVEVEKLEGILPLSGEIVGLEPCQHLLKGPLGRKIGRD